MKNILALVLVAAATLAGSASAETPTAPPYAPLTTDIQAPKPHSAYVQDARGVIVRNPFGLCWRTGYWTPADAVPGCDLPICVEPETLVDGKCVAPPPPPPPPAPAAVEEPAATPAAEPVPTSEKVSYSADAFFDFDKAVLKPDGKKALDELAANIQGVNVEVIIAEGHTDSIGTDAYNEKLAIRRAESVKKYLVDKGIDASRVYVEGKGEKQPVADNKTSEGRAKNRRVEIEVVGTRTVSK
ncbi:MAG TPA: OmpA family protein [Telluria sp.]|nr:OmpA family protein [Telluria sp.]